MRILVTGGAGFIGSNLVRFLINETKHEVLNVDKLTYAGNLNSLTDLAGDASYNFADADITCLESLRREFVKFQPTAVMHLAAESHVDRSIDSPGAFINTNIVGTYNVLQAARELYTNSSEDGRRDFRFLHVSTDEVYGSLEDDSHPFRETDAYDPHSPYSASKAASDHLARAWHDTFSLPVIITNCSNNYGPFQYPEKLIPVIIINAIHHQSIPVYGDGRNIRDWLHVGDHVRGLYSALTKGMPGETYNLGGDSEMTNIELVRSICRILDEVRPWRESGTVRQYEELITFVRDRPGHDMRYAIDATKAKECLGWMPLKSVDVGLKKTVEWYLANSAWWSQILKGEHQLQRVGLAEAA